MDGAFHFLGMDFQIFRLGFPSLGSDFSILGLHFLVLGLDSFALGGEFTVPGTEFPNPGLDFNFQGSICLLKALWEGHHRRPFNLRSAYEWKRPAKHVCGSCSAKGRDSQKEAIATQSDSRYGICIRSIQIVWKWHQVSGGLA